MTRLKLYMEALAPPQFSTWDENDAKYTPKLRARKVDAVAVNESPRSQFSHRINPENVFRPNRLAQSRILKIPYNMEGAHL